MGVKDVTVRRHRTAPIQPPRTSCLQAGNGRTAADECSAGREDGICREMAATLVEGREPTMPADTQLGCSETRRREQKKRRCMIAGKYTRACISERRAWVERGKRDWCTRARKQRHLWDLSPRGETPSA